MGDWFPIDLVAIPHVLSYESRQQRKAPPWFGIASVVTAFASFACWIAALEVSPPHIVSWCGALLPPAGLCLGVAGWRFDADDKLAAFGILINLAMMVALAALLLFVWTTRY